METKTYISRILLSVFCFIEFIIPGYSAINYYDTFKYNFKKSDYISPTTFKKSYENHSDNLNPNLNRFDVTNQPKKNNLYENLNSLEVENYKLDLNYGIVGSINSSDDPSDNVFNFSLNNINEFNKYELSYNVIPRNNSKNLFISLNSKDSKYVSLDLKSNKENFIIEELNVNTIKEGLNNILFTTTNNSEFIIKDLSLKVLKKYYSNKDKLRINSVSFFDDNVYIKGYINNNLDNNKILIDDKEIIVDNEFEFVTKGAKNSFLKFLDSKIPLSNFSSNNINTKNLDLDKLIYSSNYVNSEEDNSLVFENISFKIKKNSYKSNFILKVSNLNRKNSPSLPQDIVNTTYGGLGYRCLPDGIVFDSLIEMTMKYDEKKLPRGYSPKEIKSFYFDTKTKKWVNVPVIKLDTENKTITCLTNHFTDYINGVIQAPESPETSAYTPTTISDIKVGNPTSKINLISPPQANQEGSANLSYPIELPPGRAGMIPNLAINYNSDASNSWLGLGWNLSVPSVDIDTRWGSPEFNTNLESELYSVAGEQVGLQNNINSTDLYLPNKAQNFIGRVNNAIFKPRVNTSFNNIERLGNSPTNYTWKVTDKNGTIYFYGDTTNSKILDDNGNIIKWNLSKVQDKNGNYYTYTYIQKNYISGTLAGGKQLYLHKINYTAHTSNSNAPYEVEFETTSIVPGLNTERQDKNINFKLGTKLIIDDVLKTIKVKFQNQVVRKYNLYYKKGIFGKTLLEKIEQTDGDGTLFNDHTFEYHDTTENGTKLFAEQVSFSNVGNDLDIRLAGFNLPSEIKGTAISSSRAQNYGLSWQNGIGFASLGIPTTLNIFSKDGTINNTWSITKSENKGELLLSDIDGDGLPDKVFKSGDGLKYRKNLGNNQFSSYLNNINGINSFSYSSSESLSRGVSAMLANVSVGYDRGWTTSETKKYVSDVNGDGLLDVVDHGNVFFGSIRNGIPTYTTNSIETPNVIFQGVDNQLDDIGSQLPEIPNDPLEIVRFWEAPFNTTINITGSVSLSSNNGEYGNILYRIEKSTIAGVLGSMPAQLLGSTTLNSSNTNYNNFHNNINIQKGERIYFRFRADETGVLNFIDHSNLSVEIQNYVYDGDNFSSTLSNTQDYNGKFFLKDNSSTDYLLSYPDQFPILKNGQYTISFPLVRFNENESDKLSDLVTFSIVKNTIQNGNYTTTTVYEGVYNPFINNVLSFTQSFDITEINQETNDTNVYFTFHVKAESNVNWQAISNKWKPTITFNGQIEQGEEHLITNLPVQIIPELGVYNQKVNDRIVYKKTNYFLDGFTTKEQFHISIPESFTPCLTCNENRELFVGIKNVKGAYLKYIPNSLQLNIPRESNRPGLEIIDPFPGVDLPVTPVLPDDPIDNPNYNYSNLISIAKFKFVINNAGEVVGKFKYDINTNTYLPFGRFEQYNTLVVVSDETNYSYDVFPEFYTDDLQLANDLNNQTFNYKYRTTTTNTGTYTTWSRNFSEFKAPIYTKNNNFIKPVYKNWGQFVYKTQFENNVIRGIKNSDLSFNENPTYSLINSDGSPVNMDNVGNMNDEEYFNYSNSLVSGVVSLLSPGLINQQYYNNLNQKVWVGNNNKFFISNNYISPTREMDNTDTDVTVEVPSVVNPTETSAKAPVKVSKSTANTFSGGFIANGGINTGKNETLIEFFDINGDGYPDRLSGNSKITNALGKLSSNTVYSNYNLLASKTSSLGTSISLGTSPLISYIKNLKSGATGVTGGAKPSAGLASSQSKDESSYIFIDINGDGLTDKVSSDGNLSFNKGLNFGFVNSSGWNYGNVNIGKSSGINLSAGIQFFNNSLSAGLSIGKNSNYSEDIFIDINGDGLPDKLHKDGNVNVKINTGFGFIDANNIANLSQTSNGLAYSISPNAGVTYASYLLIPFVGTGPKFSNTISPNYSFSISGESLQYTDMNGDGFVDIVESNDNSELKVRYNIIGKTNLLKTVHNPLGGTITLDYDTKNKFANESIGNTFQMPNTKYALTYVEIYDGYEGDGQDVQKLAFEYFDGYKDRREREFLGFNVIKTHQLNRDNAIYISNVTEYLNANLGQAYYEKGALHNNVRKLFFQKGLVAKSYTQNAAGRIYNSSKNYYTFKKGNLTADVNLSTNYATNTSYVVDEINYTETNTITPLLTGTISSKTENNRLGSHTQSLYAAIKKYDKYGNVKTYVDQGETQSNTVDDITINILYHAPTSNNCLAIPQEHTVTTNGQVVRRNRTFIDNNGNVNEIRRYLTNSLTTNYTQFLYKYDIYGNISSVTLPLASSNSTDRQSYFYEYDLITQTHITSVKNARGSVSSFWDIDYRFGVPTVSKDINGIAILYTYDNFGRVKSVKGPYHDDWTINFDYFKNPDNGLWQSLTQHNVQEGIIFTNTYVDGLGRTIQTAVSDNTCNCDGINAVISGTVYYDEFGRVVEQNQNFNNSICDASTTDEKSFMSRLFIQPQVTQLEKTFTTYDVLGRALTTTQYNANNEAITVTNTFGYNQDYFGVTQFSTLVTDPMGYKTISFTNAKGLTTSTKQMGAGSENLWTSFEYDRLNQVVRVKDANENSTTYTYDNFGRKTQVNHPDRGIQMFEYDLLGRIINYKDANLIQQNQQIIYNYDFDRLNSITYPTHTVQYEYGSDSTMYNNERLIKKIDLSGIHEYRYGLLGEVVFDKYIMIDPTNQRKIFNTTYDYDSWGRVKTIIYPDAEVVNYSYNRGGNLTTIKNTDEYHYLANACYNEDGLLKSLAYGNNTSTVNTYDNLKRLSRVNASGTVANFMNVIYTYDKNNNILSTNDTPSAEATMGGRSTKEYVYDQFNRLSEAINTLTTVNSSEEVISNLKMTYNNVHAITSKYQDVVNSVELDHLQYNNIYNYEGARPNAVTSIHSGNTEYVNAQNFYTYDANGNMTREFAEDEESGAQLTKSMFWDEQNRLLGIYTNNNLSTHFYNDGGERVLKNVIERIDITENGQQTVGEYISKGTIFYPSGIFVYSPKYYTKHYYMGSKRIASRIGRPSEQNYFTFDDSEYTDILNQIKNTQTQLLQPIYEVTNITEPNTDTNEEDLEGEIYNIANSFDDMSEEAIKELFAQSLAMLNHNPNIEYGSKEWAYCSKFLVHAYYGNACGGSPSNDFDGTRQFQCYNTIKELVLDAEAFQLDCLIKPTSKTNTWWYHTDHLGSTSYITDSNGVVSHYYNYLPFGELFNEQRFSLYDNVYKFNAKELDDASGLYYYSARYYDPKLSIFLSVDPLAEEFEEWNPYAYTFNNPINFIDPTGMAPEDIRIFGANNSSVTIKTDLIDISVNASSIVGDLGGNYTFQGTDILIAALDIVGVVDPTPIADLTAASLEAKQGNWWSAAGSALGVVPLIGDAVGKSGKIGKHVKTINNAIDAAKTEKKATGSYTIGFESGKKYHGKGPESRMNKSANDKAKAYNDPVKSKDFTKAKNDREAFKQESRRIDTDRVGNTPGHKNPNNYNKRASPGDKYRRQDND